MGLFDFWKKKQPAEPVREDRLPLHLGQPEEIPPEIRLAEAARHLKMLNESVQILATTLSCTTFFYRYDFALEKARTILRLSRGLCNEKEAQEMVDRLERDRAEIINAFLHRCFEAGQIRWVERPIRSYMDKLPPESRQLLADMLQIERLKKTAHQHDAGAAIAVGLLGAKAMTAGATGHRHSRRCDGNCDRCPPHYGYRYGRWYYGHGHQHGCERGGNGGATGRTYRD